MLIRVISHFRRKENVHGIDELININGLPEELMFRKAGDKTYLKFPWEMDIDVNIPVHIREHCTPMDITVDLPPEKNEATGVWQRPSDTKRVLGVKINLDHTPGREMWTQVERILDRGTPRDQKVPSPRPVAPNQKESFSLEAGDIPVVNLRPEVTSPIIQPSVTVSTDSKPVFVETKAFTCTVCNKSFKEQRGLWMHERKTRHKAGAPVAA